MKTWEEYINENIYNENIYGEHGERYTPVNVKCPECGKPLYKRTDIVLASFPPQYVYRCIECGWSGYARI